MARDGEKLAAIADDLKARGAGNVQTVAEDLADTDGADARFSGWVQTLGGVDIVFLAYGILGDQAEAQRDTDALLRGIGANFTSAVVWCELAARAFELAGSGTLVGISSVAGDRAGAPTTPTVPPRPGCRPIWKAWHTALPGPASR